MANEFEELSESGFVIVSLLTAGQFEIDFGEVHTKGLWDESLEEFESEVEADAVTFACTSALESATVDTVDVEGDPVFGLILMVEILMNGLVHSL